MRTTEEILEDLGDWPLLCCFLPEGWQEQARTCGALTRSRGVCGPEKLLRILLIHLAHGCSLAETAVRARQGGLGDLSAVALHKRLRASEEWLRWLAEQVRPRAHAAVPKLGRRVVAVDATTVSEPGSTGTDWRLHYAVNVSDLQCVFFELTDGRGGESWRRFPVRRGDILLADRAYSTSSGVARVSRLGGDVVTRMRIAGFPLQDADGSRLAPLELVRGLRVGWILDRPAAAVSPEGRLIPGRVVAIKRGREATRRARKTLSRRASRSGEKISAESWKAAAYFFIRTTLSSQPPQTVMTLYRLRWQIELVFKRLKSVLGLGHLPKKDPASARAWMHGKLFTALLVERLIHEFDAFSPWGYVLEQPPQPLERERIRPA